MARTKRTPRKNLSPIPIAIRRTTKFYTFKMSDRHDIRQFLHQFRELWASVRDYGISELDGVLQLVQALPQKWKPWASVAALDFVHPDMEVRVTGKLFDFIDLVLKQFQLSNQPPVGPYPPLNQFITSVHQISDDILDSRRRVVDIDPLESVNGPENPNVEHVESPFCARPGIISIDMDLYGQPFVLEPPSPPLFLINLLSDKRLASTSGNASNEPETHLSIGTSRVQPLTIGETSFAIEPQNSDHEAPVRSNASSFHPQEEEEEEDPEIPEGYYDS